MTSEEGTRNDVTAEKLPNWKSAAGYFNGLRKNENGSPLHAALVGHPAPTMTGVADNGARLFVEHSSLLVSCVHRLRFWRILLPQKYTQHYIDTDDREFRFPALKDREPEARRTDIGGE